MSRCIIVDKMHPSIIGDLEQLGYVVDYLPNITRTELLDSIGTYRGLIIRSKTLVDAEMLAKASQLQFVARAGAGLDNIDIQILGQHGIQVINAPEGNRDSLAEHAIGMLLGLMHYIPQAHQSVRSKEWQRETYRGNELGGKTVGLVGFGNMGQALAQRLRSFNCQILVYDKYLKGFGEENVQEVPIEKLYASCDILSLHVPLTAETRGFYDYSFFKNFKKSLIVLNTARGEILPLSDLKKLMEEGIITAAALDVLEVEPISQLVEYQHDVFDFLRNSPNILLSPHIAGWSQESYYKINATLVSKIANLKKDGVID